MAWASRSSIRRAASILRVTVIVVSFFESVVRDHSKDHAVTVTRYEATRSPPNPYTTLLDSTDLVAALGKRGGNSGTHLTGMQHPDRGHRVPGRAPGGNPVTRRNRGDQESAHPG